MPHHQISDADLDGLDATLETLRPHVSAHEWTVLSAVVDAGVTALRGAADAAPTATRPPAFGTFSPGSDDDGSGGGGEPQKISRLPDA